MNQNYVSFLWCGKYPKNLVSYANMQCSILIPNCAVAHCLGLKVESLIDPLLVCQ